MDFGFQHERKGMRRMTEFKEGKTLLPKSKSSVELPFDVIVSILIRLPARRLQRMRSVCRSWSSLISDSHFIREYSNFRASVTKRPYIISLHRCSQLQSIYKMKFFPEGDDYHHEFDVFRDLVGIQHCKVLNSCDGLICVVGAAFTYLVNPSIQKVRALLKRSWHLNMSIIHSAGLGFNNSTGEYKVVLLFQRSQYGHFECEVYTIGNLHSPSCWRVIDNPPLEPSCSSLPIFVNGAIHWTVGNGMDWTVGNGMEEVSPEIALSFDMKTEKFDVILHPEGSSRPRCSRVVELGGLLCLACTHRDRVRMDIWALKDRNSREWMKQYNVDLPTMYDYGKCLAFWTKPVTIYDGKIVFCNDIGSMDYYDPQSKSFVKHMHVSTDFVYVVAYTESIVWPMQGSQRHRCSFLTLYTNLVEIARFYAPFSQICIFFFPLIIFSIFGKFIM